MRKASIILLLLLFSLAAFPSWGSATHEEECYRIDGEYQCYEVIHQSGSQQNAGLDLSGVFAIGLMVNLIFAAAVFADGKKRDVSPIWPFITLVFGLLGAFLYVIIRPPRADSNAYVSTGPDEVNSQLERTAYRSDPKHESRDKSSKEIQGRPEKSLAEQLQENLNEQS